MKTAFVRHRPGPRTGPREATVGSGRSGFSWRRPGRTGRVLAVLALLVLGGCESVYAPRPMGTAPVALDESWSGTWLADGAAVTTRVQDAANGRLQVAWIESGAETLEIEVLDGVVRSGADRVFFSVKDRETEHGFQWLVVDHAPERIRAWYPDPEAFVAAVERGEIPGKVFEGSVILGELTDEQLARIADPASGLLEWREPLVLLRIGRD